MNKILSCRCYIYVIVLVTFILRYFQIFTVEYPNGWDGAYYEMQLDYWLTNGRMHSENFSLIYILLKTLTPITSPTLAYKLVTVLAASLFPIFIVSILLKTTGKIESFVIWLFMLSSPLLLFISHQFTKNLLGLDILLLYFIFNKKWWHTALIIALTFFTHRIAFLMLITIIATEQFKTLSKRQFLYVVLLGSLACMITFFIPGLPTPLDYLRVSKEVSLSAYWAPLKFYELWNITSFNFIWYIEAVSIHLLLILGGYFVFNQKKNTGILFVIVLFLIPVYNFSTGSLGYRLYFNAFCLLFLLIPPILKLPYAKYVVAIISVLSIPWSLFAYKPKTFDPPIATYKMISDKIKTAINPTDTVQLVIAHKGIKEQILLRTKYDALNWQPDDSLPSPFVYRIVHGISDREIIELQGKQQSKWKKLSKSYYLTKEYNWRLLLEALEEEGRYSRIKELKTWLNPYETRPLYLR